MLPELTRNSLLLALDEFDRERRGTPHEASWEDSQSQEFALEHKDLRYPVKTVASLASGVPVKQISWQDACDALTQLGFQLTSTDGSSVLKRQIRAWWINHGDSFDRESAGGYIQSPRLDRGGADRGLDDRLRELRAGDVTVHYADQRVVALGRVISSPSEVQCAASARRRKSKKRSRIATRSSPRAEIEYVMLGARAVVLSRFIELFPCFGIEDGPFEIDHRLKKGYLWAFSIDALRRLHDLIGDPWPSWAPLEAVHASANATLPAHSFPLERAVTLLIDAVAARGMHFQPWQIAAYITALRTKPFVILAGVSGTGKSRLPREVAELTKCAHQTIAVRSDWADSSDLIGYVDLKGSFRPGQLMLAAERAERAPAQLHVCILDEMNLARVEHYFAEVLSRIERRFVRRDGSVDNEPLLGLTLSSSDARWAKIALPGNLAIIGTVNMDDSTHPFSRKVLDRAFTFELSEIDLQRWGEVAGGAASVMWPGTAWQAGTTSLAQRAKQPEVAKRIREIINVLVQINEILQPAQLQIAYRSRDEIVLFVLNAAELTACFVTRDGATVDPLDLVLMMKILPRIVGSSRSMRGVLIELLLFAYHGSPASQPGRTRENCAIEVCDGWCERGQPSALNGAEFPRSAARLCLMWQRLQDDGFASFWL